MWFPPAIAAGIVIVIMAGFPGQLRAPAQITQPWASFAESGTYTRTRGVHFSSPWGLGPPRCRLEPLAWVVLTYRRGDNEHQRVWEPGRNARARAGHPALGSFTEFGPSLPVSMTSFWVALGLGPATMSTGQRVGRVPACLRCRRGCLAHPLRRRRNNAVSRFTAYPQSAPGRLPWAAPRACPEGPKIVRRSSNCSASWGCWRVHSGDIHRTNYYSSQLR